MKSHSLTLILAFVCFVHSQSKAQTTDENTPTYWLDEVVVVADRTQNLLRESTWATSVLTGETLQQLPAKTLGDALRYVPGLTFVEKDGSGHVPMAIVRGFFGGGETEYILLTVDGVPVNDLRTGLIEWSQIPVSAIERIEVLRGGASAVYGDAALGAVINIKTRQTAGTRIASTNIAFGQRGERSLNLANEFHFGKHNLKLRASTNNADGFRSHSKWENNFFNGRYHFGDDQSNAFYFHWDLARLENQDPGPLTEDRISEDRSLSNPLFNQDSRRRNKVNAALGYKRHLTESSRFSTDVGVRFLDQEQTRTLLVAPGFGDTQLQKARDLDFWSRMQYQQNLGQFDWLVGLESGFGSYDSEYFDVQDRNILNSAGNGERLRAGLFLEAQGKITSRLRASAGARYDYIRDQHKDRAAETTTEDFSQVSPRVGINFAYSANPHRSGNIYANWTRSFKAPSLDQLFDERQINSGIPGVFINISNAQLQPQRAKGFELGLYQKIPVVNQRIYSELTVSAYRLELDDEIDFDLATFRYGNIQKSRHDGLESSVTLYFLPRFSITSTLNYMNVTFRSGENEGKALKNIPKAVVQNHFNIHLNSHFQLTLAHRYQSKVYLDDTNTTSLSGHQTFDTQLRLKTGLLGLSLLIKNIANNHYNSSGFVLFDQQTFQNVAFLNPAEGRYFQTTLDFAF